MKNSLRKTVVLEKMKISNDNPQGAMRLTNEVLEKKEFDEKNAEQILADGALSKQWRRKAVQPQESRLTSVKTIVEETKAPKSNNIIDRISSSEDIGFLQSLMNDKDKAIVSAAKARLKQIA